jgi:hypothetical protein
MKIIITEDQAKLLQTEIVKNEGGDIKVTEEYLKKRIPLLKDLKTSVYYVLLKNMKEILAQSLRVFNDCSKYNC